MTDKLPPQWAINLVTTSQKEYLKFINACDFKLLRDPEFSRRLTIVTFANLLAEERERCAKLCDDEKHRLEQFNTRDGIVLSLCAEQIAIKIRSL